MSKNDMNSAEKRLAITAELRLILNEFYTEHRRRLFSKQDYTREELSHVVKQRIIDKWFRFAQFGVTCRADIDKLTVSLRSGENEDTGFMKSVDISLTNTKLHVPKIELEKL